jgi:hypothetical protein
MSEDDDTLKAQAEKIVNMIRAQNWKNGGIHIMDQYDAIALVTQALRAAEAAGANRGVRELGKSMSATMDRLNPVSAALAEGRAPSLTEVMALIAPDSGEGEV